MIKMKGYSFKAWWCGLAPPVAVAWISGLVVGFVLLTVVVAAAYARRRWIG